MVYHNYPGMDCKRYILESKENAGFTVVYEIYTAVKYGADQPSVHKITFRSENMANRSIEQQEESRALTKQVNCDLNVEYKTSKGILITLMDILIGRNKQFKGNLIMVSPQDEKLILSEVTQVRNKLAELISKVENKSLVNELISYQNNLSTIINDPSITNAVKILKIQEEIIQNISLMRQINPGYNPNMFVFRPNNPPLENENKTLAETFAKKITLQGGFTYNSTDSFTDLLMKDCLPIFLEAKANNVLNALSRMNIKDRKLCIKILQQYAPEFFDNYKTIIELS